jgi:hypothetical protein
LDLRQRIDDGTQLRRIEPVLDDDAGGAHLDGDVATLSLRLEHGRRTHHANERRHLVSPPLYPAVSRPRVDPKPLSDFPRRLPAASQLREEPPPISIREFPAHTRDLPRPR